jgi:7-cyano-7-deazaguanine synthase
VPDSSQGAVLLLSGGLDSTALAAIHRPGLTLFVDYGQRPVRAEKQAASAVARALGLSHLAIRMDLSEIGGGLLLDDVAMEAAPSPEWWPFRNQFLGTAAAAIALKHGFHEVLLGTVQGDGERHLDGTPRFYSALDAVTAMQEGAVRVDAPAISMSTLDLVRESGLGQDTLGWTVSCHRGDFPCHACPGCYKRDQVLHNLFPGPQVHD